MDFRKTYFVLPNLFTLACVFCGFYAVTLCAKLGNEGSDEDLLYKASLAVVLGLFFDATDGRIARLTRTQSELGLNLDSLADVITFGLAPALIVYRWALEDMGRLGLAVAFLFVACGALRLARFNVLSMREKESKPGKYMLGLPIPIAANALVGLVLVNHAVGVEFAVNQPAIAVVVVVLAYLMISRVRFRSMKDIKLNRRTIGIGVVLTILAIVVGARMHAPAVFMLLVGTYITLGLVEELVFFRRRRREDKANRAQRSQTAIETEPAAEPEPEDDEQEVLAELGAVDSATRAVPDP